ncbi:4-diphosphocytidyl-2-C-methyl-D-erythritol kinase [Chitinispirillum alkaliphilum]|nr:4-diphosphocytidyl-2-C-methyl-D-erythritol kinase [Chitinispirillum alkaliphilum]
MLHRDSNTRLTLSLDIVKKIESGSLRGYHELGIIKHQITLHDTISIEENRSMLLECDNEMVPCDESNICWRAAELVRKRFSIDRNVRISIIKRIPVMGGLAGGSANAATVITLLCELWDLKISEKEKMELGRELGMDVPFFFTGKTAFDTEATGIIKPVDTSLRFVFVLAFPPFGISTREAYGLIDYKKVGKKVGDTEKIIASLSQNNRSALLPLLHNDFQLSAFSRHRDLELLREKMIDAGCEQVVMSGSGSTLVGIVPDHRSANNVQKSLDCKTVITQTL